jgi:hypothetical protein
MEGDDEHGFEKAYLVAAIRLQREAARETQTTLDGVLTALWFVALITVCLVGELVMRHLAR